MINYIYGFVKKQEKSCLGFGKNDKNWSKKEEYSEKINKVEITVRKLLNSSGEFVKIKTTWICKYPENKSGQIPIHL